MKHWTRTPARCAHVRLVRLGSGPRMKAEDAEGARGASEEIVLAPLTCRSFVSTRLNCSRQNVDRWALARGKRSQNAATPLQASFLSLDVQRLRQSTNSQNSFCLGAGREKESGRQRQSTVERKFREPSRPVSSCLHSPGSVRRSTVIITCPRAAGDVGTSVLRNMLIQDRSTEL